MNGTPLCLGEEAGQLLEGVHLLPLRVFRNFKVHIAAEVRGPRPSWLKHSHPTKGLVPMYA